MKDPVGVFGCRRGFSFLEAIADHLLGAMRLGPACPSVRAGTSNGLPVLSILGILSRKGVMDARVAGNSAQRDRLCRVYRHRKVSQGARRKIAGSLRIEREANWPCAVRRRS